MKKQPKVKSERVNKVLAVVERFLPEMGIKTIKDGDDFNHAVEILSQLNRRLDEVVAEKEKVTKPLNEALRAERERFKPYETKLSGAIDAIRNEMSRYKMKLDAANRSVQQKVAEDVAAGRIGIDKAVAKLSDAGRKVIEGPVSTASGAVKFRVDKVVKIVSLKDLPKEYMVADLVAIKKALMGGETVAGAVLEEVQTVVNSR